MPFNKVSLRKDKHSQFLSCWANERIVSKRILLIIGASS